LTIVIVKVVIKKPQKQVQKLNIMVNKKVLLYEQDFFVKKLRVII